MKKKKKCNIDKYFDIKMIIIDISKYNYGGYKTLLCSFHDQVNPGESYDPLLMSLVKSTSISVDEQEDLKDF